MKLSQFIIDEMDQILSEWDEYALSLTPAADDMSHQELRDHAKQMLEAVALDIDTPQSAKQQRSKSQGDEDDEDGSNAASEHGELRHASHFSMLQVSSEFRALRASVLRLWLHQVDASEPGVLEDMVRFNESIDQALADSIRTFTARTERTRDLFDAILSHDLRGPLSSLSLAGELLVNRELPADKVKEIGANVRRSSRFMASMVDDMLEFARTRMSGTSIPVNPTRQDVSVLCANAIADANAMHPRCTFELETSGRMDACVDANRMHQLLVNLLGNAGQHGAPARPIQVHVSGDDERTVLQVINEGPEIAPESLKKIFKPMVRLNSEKESPSRSTTSLGLGLHIACEIAKAHGGRIKAKSEAGHTTFSVTLPRHAHSKQA